VEQYFIMLLYYEDVNVPTMTFS